MEKLEIVNRVRGVEVNDFIMVKDNNDSKVRYGKVFYIHPEKRYLTATITSRYNIRYNECFTNEEIVIIPEEDAQRLIKEKYDPDSVIDFKTINKKEQL